MTASDAGKSQDFSGCSLAELRRHCAAKQNERSARLAEKFFSRRNRFSSNSFRWPPEYEWKYDVSEGSSSESSSDTLPAAPAASVDPLTIVTVYKINNLSCPHARNKVHAKAHRYGLAGCAVTSDEGVSVVAVEGSWESIKRFKKVMLKRIDWAAAVKKEEDGENGDSPINKCHLVLQYRTRWPRFSGFSIHDCRTKAAARKFFVDAEAFSYWGAVEFKEG